MVVFTLIYVVFFMAFPGILNCLRSLAEILKVGGKTILRAVLRRFSTKHWLKSWDM